MKLEVEVRQTGASEDGGAGLVCRNDGRYLYAFMLFPESFSASISRYDYETDEWVFLAGGDLPDDVRLAPSGQPNRIGAECIGRRLTMLLNGREALVALAVDDAIGQVAILSSAERVRQPYDAVFTGFKAWWR